MITYLITGGAGFIGSNFVKHILKKYDDIKIIVVDCLTYAGNLKNIEDELLDKRVKFEKVNICNSGEIKRIFLENNINYVVNFAAESHVDRSIENPQIFLMTNILGVQNLLDVSKDFWTVGQDEKGYPIYKENIKFIQMSTDEVYGSLEEGDDSFKESSNISPNSPYSASKSGADHLVLAYAKTYKIPVNIVRSSNNYGPFQYPEKLIPFVIKNILENKKLPLYGNGENIRDWIYVEDCCKAIDLIVNKGRKGEIYNVGGNSERENIDIVKSLIDISKDEFLNNKEYEKFFNITLDKINYSLIEFVQDRLGHDKRYGVNFEKIKNELGWEPETDLQRGLINTVKWYFNNYGWLKNTLKKI